MEKPGRSRTAVVTAPKKSRPQMRPRPVVLMHKPAKATRVCGGATTNCCRSDTQIVPVHRAHASSSEPVLEKVAMRQGPGFFKGVATPASSSSHMRPESLQRNSATSREATCSIKLVDYDLLALSWFPELFQSHNRKFTNVLVRRQAMQTTPHTRKNLQEPHSRRRHGGRHSQRRPAHRCDERFPKIHMHLKREPAQKKWAALSSEPAWSARESLPNDFQPAAAANTSPQCTSSGKRGSPQHKN